MTNQTTLRGFDIKVDINGIVFNQTVECVEDLDTFMKGVTDGLKEAFQSNASPRNIRCSYDEVVVGDRRYQQWIKHVTDVDFDKKGGYAFLGEFVGNHGEDFVLSEGSVVLAKGMEGSRRRQSPTAQLYVVSTAEGSTGGLYPVEYSDGNNWWLDLRDTTSQLLAANKSYKSARAALACNK